MKIETERLLLRPAGPDDAAAIAMLKSDPLVREMALGHDYEVVEEAERADLARTAEDPDQVLRQGSLVAGRVAGIELDGLGEDGAGGAPRVRHGVGIVRTAKPPQGRGNPRRDRTRDHRKQEQTEGGFAESEEDHPSRGSV